MDRVKHVLPFCYAAITIVVIWELVLVITHPSPAVLPTPSAVAYTFIQLIGNGQLILDTAYSLYRVIMAWMISIIIAVPLGLLIGSAKRLDKYVSPVIELLRPISPLAWIPLAILWFGISETGKIFVVFIGTVYPILLNSVAGAKSIDPDKINAARVFGCSNFYLLFVRVIIPASIPNIMVGLRMGFGLGWAAIIAAELVASNSGLGYLISNGMDLLRADIVVVGMITIGILGFLFDIFFRALQRKFATYA